MTLYAPDRSLRSKQHAVRPVSALIGSAVGVWSSMRSSIVEFGAAVGIMLIASSLAGCVAGSAGYAGWAAYRQQQANDHAHLSQRNTAAARAQARSGNYSGARLLEAAAEDEAVQAEE